MSRIAKSAISIPAGIDVSLSGQDITVKGPKGILGLKINSFVTVSKNADSITFAPKKEVKEQWAMAGTTRALVNNMVVGVKVGFEKKLKLIGVGYRAQAKGRVLGLSLGFSHPVEYSVPEGVDIVTPSQTEIILTGCDKQQVGQVAAEIRAFRPPEPYKGKGVRYSDEVVVRKEAKKK